MIYINPIYIYALHGAVTIPEENGGKGEGVWGGGKGGMRRRGNNNPPPPPFTCVAGATFSPPGGARVAGLGRGMTHPTFRSKTQNRGNHGKLRKSPKSLNFRKSQYFRVFSENDRQKGLQNVAFIKGFRLGAQKYGISVKRAEFRDFRTFL